MGSPDERRLPATAYLNWRDHPVRSPNQFQNTSGGGALKTPIFSILAALASNVLISCGSDNSSSPTPGAEAIPYTKSDHGIPWTAIAGGYGVIQDSRDGQLYRTVKIGNQTWMAENLSYKHPGSDSGSCQASSSDTCAKYGRLYTWTTAMDGANSSASVPSGVRGLCPSGLHVPSIAEWDSLVAFVERDAGVGSGNGGKALKASLGWTPVGSDLFGFRGLPSGYLYTTGNIEYLGVGGGWWSATKSDSLNAYRRDLGSTYANVYRGTYEKKAGFSVRCVQD